MTMTPPERRLELRKDFAIALSGLAPSYDQECEMWRCVGAIVAAAERDAALRAIEACAAKAKREGHLLVADIVQSAASDPEIVPKEVKKP